MPALPSTVAARQVSLQSLQIRNGYCSVQRNEEFTVELFCGEASPSSVFSSVPESDYIRKRHIIKFIPAGEVQQNEGNALLLLKGAHERDLMFMDVVQRECIGKRFLCVKTDRYSLNDTDVVDGTLLVKIRKCDVTRLLVDLKGLDGRRDFLDEGELLTRIPLVCDVDQVFQGRSP